ncbi:hypothetical protein C1H46_003484 [Malus baccata]|uniref:Uncharacterized protein n=1 Tax=Malus baccata TaxID=106549 RepID=A0A540NIQ1_MALBA|nr:hypothetical protein C1H46_003484 [Malus baccata]
MSHIGEVGGVKLVEMKWILYYYRSGPGRPRCGDAAVGDWIAWRLRDNDKGSGCRCNNRYEKMVAQWFK